MDTQKDSHRPSLRLVQRLGHLLILSADSGPGTLLICTIATFLLMHNYILPLNSLLYTTGIKGQDCGQMIWNLWFANEAITSGHSPFVTNLLFYPLGANLGHHTLAAGFFPLTFLVKKLSGNDPLYPFYAFKIIIFFSFTLILWLSYLTLREVGLTRWSASIPAVGYAFSDFYKLHVIHINHLAGFFIPLTALLLVRAYKKPASANLGLAALAAGCSVYFTEFSIYICVAVIFFVSGAGLLRSGRHELIARSGEAGQRRVITSGLIYLLLVAPFTINLFRDKIVNPPPSEPSHYSANLAGFFLPGKERDQVEVYTPLTTPLYRHAFDAVDSKITVGIGGFEIFVGFPLLLFSGVALLLARQRLVWLCIAIGFVFFVLSLGPTLKVFGTETGMPLPYALLMHIPPFDTGRTPVRFVVMGLFFLMIVAAVGLSWTESFVAARWGRRWACLAMFFLLAWTTAEVYSPTQHRSVFVAPAGLSNVVPGAVLNLPPVQRDGYAAMLQALHHQAIAGGYLARNNSAQDVQLAAIKMAFDQGGAPFCDFVRSKGIHNIVIAPDSVTRPSQFSMSPLELSRCAVNIVDLRDRGPGPFGLVQSDGSEKPVEYPPYTPGTRLDFGAAPVDRYLWYGWSVREARSRWTERGQATLIFGLNSEGQRLKSTLRIFGEPFLAPGKLDTQRVIVKLNGQQVADWRHTTADPREQSIEIPAGTLRDQNTLMFLLPDAASPQSLGVSGDPRLLGFNVQWIEID